jgi:protein-tyrosine phosphatase
MIRICFVCLGNICRSPTAEALFRLHADVARLGDRFEIDSCGTGGWHIGELAHAGTRAYATSQGVDIPHRARQLGRDDFERFDLLVAMDQRNQRDIVRAAPICEVPTPVVLLRDFDTRGRGQDVPDPYHSGEFDTVFDICKRSSDGLLQAIVASNFSIAAMLRTTA